MANIVFTGKYNHGRRLTRVEVTAEAIRAGHHVQNAVDPSTHYLVASRSDTSKAQAAVAMGVQVISYASYYDLIVNPNTGRWRDPIPPGNRRPIQSANLGGINLEELALTNNREHTAPPITKRAKIVPKPPARVPGRRALDLG